MPSILEYSSLYSPVQNALFYLFSENLPLFTRADLPGDAKHYNTTLHQKKKV